MGKFITGFCKVEFLCYQGEPNWLGWGLLGIGFAVALYFSIIIYYLILK